MAHSDMVPIYDNFDCAVYTRVSVNYVVFEDEDNFAVFNRDESIAAARAILNHFNVGVE